MNVTRKVGVVVIGRNEGEKLTRCIDSLLLHIEPSSIVYVDSQSSDRSAERVRALGVVVVELDSTRKFTAARARNTGLWRLLELRPEIELVQFVDGDCEVAADWMPAAEQRFAVGGSDLAVVCGRRRERAPDHSLYNRLCDLEWDTPLGEAQACGGDAMILAEALRRVDGYRESLIAGEEPEMCYRMRLLGYRVERIDREMTVHDANIVRASQWFKRTKRSGHAFAEHALLHGTEPERLGVKQTLSNVFWGLGVPAAVGATSVIAGPITASVGGLMAYGYLYNKSYRFERQRRDEPEAKAVAAGCVAGKFPEALGALSCFANRLLGRQTKLMEYR